jgi:hypothetical protein
MRLRLTAVLAAGRPQEARQLAVSFARLAERTRHLDHLRLMLMWDIFWAGFEGRYDDVERLAEQAADQLDRAGHPHAALVPFAYSIVPRWLHGRMELARSVVEFLHAADPDTAGWWAQSMWVDLATGNAAQAVARLSEQDPATVLAGVPRDIMWWPTLLPWAVVASHGQRPWAEALHAVLLPDSGRLMVSGYALFGGAVDHHLGTLALVLGRPDEAVQRLERALHRHRVLGASGFVGLSIRWLAGALVERGRPGDGPRAAALREELTLLIDSFGLDGLRDRDGLLDPSSVSLLGPR